MNAINDDAYFS